MIRGTSAPVLALGLALGFAFGVSGCAPKLVGDLSVATDPSEQVLPSPAPSSSPVPPAPPVTADFSQGITEDIATAITLGYTDSTPATPVTSCTASGPTGGALGACACVAGVCSVTFTPTGNLNGAGAGSFSYTVNDGLASNSSTVTINIAADNDLPVIGSNQSVNVAVGQGASFTLNAASDPDTGDTVTYTLVSGPAQGTLSNCLGTTTDRSCDYTAPWVPGSYAFTYKSNDGTGDSAANATVTLNVTAPSLTVAALYSGAPDWNDYVQAVLTTTACTGGEFGLSGCLFGGDRRKVVTVETSCTGLAMTDSLGAFDWECVMNGGVAEFYSKLKPAKGLRDLVNATSWKTNSVLLTGGGGGASTPSAWWGNTVAALPDNSAGSVDTLSAAGTIYTLASSRSSRGYNINADKIAIVTLPGATLSSSVNANNCAFTTGETASPSTRCLIAAGTQKNIWIEGSYDGVSSATTNYVFLGYQHSISTFWNASFSNGETGLRLWSTVGGSVLLNRLLGVTAASNFFDGIFVSQAVYNLIARSRVANSTAAGGTGIRLDSSSSNSLVDNVVSNVQVGLSIVGAYYNSIVGTTVSACNNGVELITASENTVVGTTVTHCGNAGILASGDRNTISQALVANNFIGLYVQSDLYTTISQIATAHNDTGIQMDFVDDGKFTGLRLMGNNTTPCSVLMGSNPGIDNACANTAASDGTLVGIGSLAGAFFGKVTADDTANSSDSTGTAAYSAALDWLGFLNPYRAWGMDGSAFPNVDNQGRCTSGTCRIWDWRLLKSNSVVRNRTHTGTADNGTENPSGADFVAGAACPAAAHGNQAAVDQMNTPNTYLLNAFEPSADNSGDDDGLCESGEICVYTPNFGSYQGHGNLGTCTFADGVVGSVTLYGYDANGAVP